MKRLAPQFLLSALRKGIAVFALLLTAGTADATVLVEFTGTVDQFNPGPLTPFTPIEGSFSIDDSIVSTGGNMNRLFLGAINDLSITIGALSFGGQGGNLTQFCSVNPPTTPPNDPVTPCGPGTRFASVSVGGSAGTVTGSAGGFAFESVNFDFRGDQLFDNPFNVANGLTRDGLVNDFSYARMTLYFDETSFGLERSLDTIHFSLIPEPNTALLLSLGLVGLATCRRAVRGGQTSV